MAEGVSGGALLLVEDDARLGPLIAEELREVYEVTLAADGAAGLDLARSRAFTALVVDRRLPELDGVGLVSTLRREGIGTPVLMLTALGSVADRVAGLDAGANDYLVKPFEFDELFARLRAITRSWELPGTTLRVGTWDFDADSRVLSSWYGSKVHLSEREAALLQVLAASPDRTFSREYLLHEVFPAGERLGTVDTYVHYLRRKVDREVVLTIRGRGYRLGSP